MRTLFLMLLCALVCTGLSACASRESPESRVPLLLETAVDTDLLMLETEDIRIAGVKAKKISYEYNAQGIKLSQVGALAKRFCQGKARDVILVDMRLTPRDGFKQATFECKDKPVLIPRGY